MSRRGRPVGPGAREPARTRQRIIEATVALHEEVGPAATTISAVAERAGVQRLTVYRHFPDEASIIAACSSHWSAAHQYPDAGAWAGITAPPDRLRRALAAIYAYFRAGDAMLARVLRDEPSVPALARAMQPYHAYFRETAAMLAAGWGVAGARQRLVRAAVAHALRFDSWRSLSSEGLTDGEAADLMVKLVAESGGRSTRRRPGPARA